MKHKGKKVLLIAFNIFVWFSLSYGMSEILYKILPDFVINLLEHFGTREPETNMIIVIPAVLSLACLHLMYLGYQCYKYGIGGFLTLEIEGFLPRYTQKFIDRDSLIYFLERKLQLTEKLNQLKEKEDNDLCEKKLTELKEVLKLYINKMEREKINLSY